MDMEKDNNEDANTNYVDYRATSTTEYDFLPANRKQSKPDIAAMYLEPTDQQARVQPDQSTGLYVTPTENENKEASKQPTGLYLEPTDTNGTAVQTTAFYVTPTDKKVQGEQVADLYESQEYMEQQQLPVTDTTAIRPALTATDENAQPEQAQETIALNILATEQNAEWDQPQRTIALYINARREEEQVSGSAAPQQPQRTVIYAVPKWLTITTVAQVISTFLLLAVCITLGWLIKVVGDLKEEID